MKLMVAILVVTFGVTIYVNPGLFRPTKGWKEEVVLHDGRVIVVKRHFTLAGYPTPDARERALIDQTISFVLPDSDKKISWHTEYKSVVPERNSLSPSLLGVVNGVPYLATVPAGCLAYNKWGRPNPPYILFKYIAAAWQQITLDEFPTELVHANLMPIPATSLLKPYYTVAAAKAEWDGNIAAYAKTILRVEVKKGGGITSCEELVLYKGSWIGPNDPVMRAIIDRGLK
ncbi:MAG: hypothetical protein OEX14_10780 [Paracoccaceae bacterium]|nr:hypothetical protein [Paracoccaceae bacterium]